MTDEELLAHRLVVRELAELFGWSDRTALHALMHVKNAVLNLRADLATERVLRDKAEANYAFMVKKVADKSLDGYRELGQRCAQLEAERDAAQAKLIGYQSAPVHMAATVLKGRLDKAEARLSKCKFCGQDVAEGAGGHTSGCYERKLDRIRAALEIDDCTAMTDAIEEALNE